MDVTLDPQVRRLSRRVFFQLCLPVILAACAPRPTASAPTNVPPATQVPLEPATAVPPTAANALAPTVTPPPAPTVAATGAVLQPTPACGDDDEPTPAQTEGPFFTPNSPERTSLLEAGLPGTPMTLTGLVLSTTCQPVAGALVDFWHADAAGVYDNAGFSFRGHQFTDAAGRYTLETIVPGLYPGRTRHFHVKVQAANQPVLTTQLYFPDEPDNARDGIFSPALLMSVVAGDGGLATQFDFVLNV